MVEYASLATGIITLGSLYALMAMGLGIVWSTTKVFNFAYGSFVTLGAYMMFVLLGSLGLPYALSFVITIFVMFLAGMGLYLGLLERALRGTEWEFNVVAITLGVAMIIDNGLLVIFGPQPQSLPGVLPSGAVLTILGVRMYQETLLITLIGILGLVSILLFLTRTKTGLAIRAIVQNRESAKLVGIKIRNMYVITVAMGIALAGLVGVLTGSIFFVSPGPAGTGFVTFLKGVAVVILGGFGNFKGTIYAAYVIAATELIAIQIFGVVADTPALFVAIMVILVIRPRGLTGVKEY